MSELKWFDAYSGQTVDELLALAGEYRVDSLVLACEEAIQRKAARDGDHSLTEEDRIILAVEALEREVNNGGYTQFFANSSREFTPIVADALSRIGCLKTARITRRAIRSLHLLSLDPESVEAAIATEDERRDDELNRCDEMFYETGEDIAAHLFGYIRRAAGSRTEH